MVMSKKTCTPHELTEIFLMEKFLKTNLNKKHGRSAILFSNGAQRKLYEDTPNGFEKETDF